MSISRKTKVQDEIDKAKARLLEQQARIKELEAKHTELENIEIVEIVRGLNIPLDDLAAVLRSVKSGTVPATTIKPAQAGPRQKTDSQESDAIKEDDPE